MGKIGLLAVACLAGLWAATSLAYDLSPDAYLPPPTIKKSWDFNGILRPVTVCGNGVVEAGEECDDGNSDAHDSCSNDCRIARCGDGIVNRIARESGEECDDGGLCSDGTVCASDSDCSDGVCRPRSGDGCIDQNDQEECDDGNTADGDGCSSLCRHEFCGDGVVQSALGEECDDGNINPYDSCTNLCKAPPLRLVPKPLPKSPWYKF